MHTVHNTRTNTPDAKRITDVNKGDKPMTNTQKQQTALDAFIEHKASIVAMLARLQKANADHFETNPESIKWADVGTVVSISNDLQNITDRVFKEGEYA